MPDRDNAVSTWFIRHHLWYHGSVTAYVRCDIPDQTLKDFSFSTFKTGSNAGARTFVRSTSRAGTHLRRGREAFRKPSLRPSCPTLFPGPPPKRHL